MTTRSLPLALLALLALTACDTAGPVTPITHPDADPEPDPVACEEAVACGAGLALSAPEADEDTPPSVFQAVAVTGATATIAAGEAGLLTIDIACNTAPEHLATIYAEPGTRVIDVLSDARPLAFALHTDATEEPSLRAVDLSNPAAPKEVGAFPGAVWEDATLDGERLFTVFGGTLAIYDTSNPASIQRLSTFTLSNQPGSAGGSPSPQLAVKGDSLYLIERNNGHALHVFDTSDPSALERTFGPLDLGDATPTDAAIFGDTLLYATTDPPTIARFDIQDPTSPVAIAPLTTNATPALATTSDALYALDAASLAIFTGDPPTQKAAIDLPFEDATALAASNTNAAIIRADTFVPLGLACP